MEFVLSIYPRAKEGDTLVPLNRDFIARALEAAAVDVRAGEKPGDCFKDSVGAEVGFWRISLNGFG